MVKVIRSGDAQFSQLLRGVATVMCRAFDRDLHDLHRVEKMITVEVNAGHRYIIATTLTNEVLGFVSWRPWGEPRHAFAELYHIGVAPEAQGHGLARELISTMESDIHAHFQSHGRSGARMVFMLTHVTNTTAQRLYDASGYQQTATLPGFFHDGVDEAVFMKRFG